MKIRSLWNLWFIGYILIANVYLIYLSIVKYLDYKYYAFSPLYGENWDLSLVHFILGPLLIAMTLLPVTIITNLIQTGNLADDHRVLAKDNDYFQFVLNEKKYGTIVPCVNSGFCSKYRLINLIYLEMPPISYLLQVIGAMCFLIPTFVIDSQYILHGVVKQNRLWHTDLDQIFNPDSQHPYMDSWNFRQPVSIAYLNLAISLIIFSIQYSRVFWLTSPAFTILFSFLLVFSALHILLDTASVSMLIKFAFNSVLLKSTVKFNTSPILILSLATLGNIMLLLIPITVFHYGVLQFADAEVAKSRKIRRQQIQQQQQLQQQQQQLQQQQQQQMQQIVQKQQYPNNTNTLTSLSHPPQIGNVNIGSSITNINSSSNNNNNNNNNNNTTTTTTTTNNNNNSNNNGQVLSACVSENNYSATAAPESVTSIEPVFSKRNVVIYVALAAAAVVVSVKFFNFYISFECIYRSTNDNLTLTNVIISSLYLFVWLLVWFAFALRKSWRFLPQTDRSVRSNEILTFLNSVDGGITGNMQNIGPMQASFILNPKASDLNLLKSDLMLQSRGGNMIGSGLGNTADTFSDDTDMSSRLSSNNNYVLMQSLRNNSLINGQFDSSTIGGPISASQYHHQQSLMRNPIYLAYTNNNNNNFGHPQLQQLQQQQQQSQSQLQPATPQQQQQQQQQQIAHNLNMVYANDETGQIRSSQIDDSIGSEHSFNSNRSRNVAPFDNMPPILPSFDESRYKSLNNQPTNLSAAMDKLIPRYLRNPSMEASLQPSQMFRVTNTEMTSPIDQQTIPLLSSTATAGSGTGSNTASLTRHGALSRLQPQLSTGGSGSGVGGGAVPISRLLAFEAGSTNNNNTNSISTTQYNQTTNGDPNFILDYNNSELAGTGNNLEMRRAMVAQRPSLMFQAVEEIPLAAGLYQKDCTDETQEFDEECGERIALLGSNSGCSNNNNNNNNNNNEVGNVNGNSNNNSIGGLHSGSIMSSNDAASSSTNSNNPDYGVVGCTTLNNMDSKKTPSLNQQQQHQQQQQQPLADSKNQTPIDRMCSQV